MIIEPLGQVPKYFPLHPLFEKAYEFCCIAERHGMPEGEFHIEGDRLIAIVSTGDREGGSHLEAHRRYIDMQYIMSGTDCIGWRSTATCQDIVSAYSKEQDNIFFGDEPASWIEIQAGCCVLLFPNDAHMSRYGERAGKKIILKIGIEL